MGPPWCGPLGALLLVLLADRLESRARNPRAGSKVQSASRAQLAGLEDIQLHRRDSLIPRSRAVQATRLPCATRSRARCRNSGGWAAGISRTPSEAVIASTRGSGKAGQAPCVGNRDNVGEPSSGVRTWWAPLLPVARLLWAGSKREGSSE